MTSQFHRLTFKKNTKNKKFEQMKEYASADCQRYVKSVHYTYDVHVNKKTRDICKNKKMRVEINVQ